MADAPLLQTENTMVGTVIDSKTNEALPLATRNYVQLTLLAPGSVHPDPSSMTNGSATGGGGRPYVNGNREQANNFLLDGLDNNQVSDNLVGYTPSVDAIAEFNMITNNASAEFGNFMGGIISTSIKSGTNEYHGNLFEFFRNDVLNANSWSNNWNGSPHSESPLEHVRRDSRRANQEGQVVLFRRLPGPTPEFPELHRHDLGAHRGGTARRLLGVARQGNSVVQSVPAGRERQPGSFREQSDPAFVAGSSSQESVRLAEVSASGRAGVQNNYFNTSASHIYQDQGDVKIDYNVNQKDRLSGRYSQSMLRNPSLNSFPLFAPGFNDTPTYNGLVNWTRTFTPRIVNEFRFGVNYVRLHNGNAFDTSAGNIAQDIGIANGNDRGPGLLSLNFGGGFASGLGTSGVQQLFADTVIQAQDGVIINTGKHIIHTGFQFMRQRINTYYSGNNGALGLIDYSGRFTAGPNALARQAAARARARPISSSACRTNSDVASAPAPGDSGRACSPRMCRMTTRSCPT